MKKYLLALAVLVTVTISLCNAQNPTFWGLSSGVQAGYGALFNVNATGGTFKIDYTFSPSDGFNPLGNLIYSNEDGLLYGLTAQGGIDGLNTQGVIFNYNMATGAYNDVYNFADVGTTSPAGQIPWGSLVQVNEGGGQYTFYGMTQQGGSYSHGMIFNYDIINGEQDLYSFRGGSDGGAPTGSLILASNGTLYGLTNYGAGTIFSFTGTVNTLHTFGSGTDGSTAPGSIIQAGNGLLYGMTQYGGTNDSGTIFSYNINTGTETVLYNFAGGTDGSQPQFGHLVQASNSLLYGMTSQGGVNGGGTIFSYNITTGVETVLHSFGAGWPDGANPLGSLIQASNGLLYGMTTGGINQSCVVFSYNITTGIETVLYHLTTADEAWPESDLLEYDIVTVGVSPASPSVCNGTSVKLTASGATTYTWSPATALSATTGATVTASPTVTTTYTVTGTTGINSNSATVIVIVNPTPTITTNTPAAYCSGGSTTLTASGGSIYTWSPATALSATTGSTVTANPTITTTYSVTSSNGTCSANTSVTVTVNPTPTITVSPNPASYCKGGSATLTAMGGSTYSWSPSKGLSAITGSSVTAKPTTTTTYTVTGVNSSGCSATKTAVVTVNPTPVVTVSASPTSICKDGISVLTASGATTYTWAPSGGLSSTTGASVTAKLPISYTYRVTGTNSFGCSQFKNISVTVNPSTAVSSQPVSVITKAGSSVQFSVTATGDSLTYQWELSRGGAFGKLVNNVTYSNVTTPTLTISNVNIHMTGYSYRCIIAGECGSVLSKAGTLTVNTSSPRPGADTYETTSQPSISDNKLFIYPNPTTGQFTIKLNGNQNGYTIEIYNVMGERVYQTVNNSLSGDSEVINLGSQPAGIYFVYLKSKNDVAIGKVLVTK